MFPIQQQVKNKSEIENITPQDNDEGKAYDNKIIFQKSFGMIKQDLNY